MKLKDFIAVWMDHETAYIFDLSKHDVIIKVDSHHKPKRIKGESGKGILLGNFRSTNNEAHIHHRQTNMEHSFYKEICSKLNDYSEIFVFGPGPARKEFCNYAREKKLLDESRIFTKSADYLTKTQMIEQAQLYFESIMSI